MGIGTLRAAAGALLGLALLGTASAQEPPARDPSFGRGERVSGLSWATRSPVVAPHAAAATAHPLATQTALDVMRAGGTAVDAAVAANAMVGAGGADGERRRRRYLRDRLGSRYAASPRLQRLGAIAARAVAGGTAARGAARGQSEPHSELWRRQQQRAWDGGRLVCAARAFRA